MLRKSIVGTALLVLLTGTGWWLGKHFLTLLPTRTRPQEAAVETMPSPPRTLPQPSKVGALPTLRGFDPEAIGFDAISGERVITFRTAEAMRKFIDSLAGTGVKLLGSIDRLNAVRVGFDDLAELLGLVGDDATPGFVWPVYVPTPPTPDAQPDAVGLGTRLHDFLGIAGDNSRWGNGVLVAILDTGVADHPTLQSSIRRISLVSDPANPSDLNGHATAVASLIAGADPRAPGVAPGVELLSIRLANDLGYSDSFTLAQGILAAVDAGAAVINISLASQGDSLVLRQAIEVARDKGIAIVASAGNDGLPQVSYPAAYPGVIGVGAVDANGSYLAFSNSGSDLTAAAPGYEITAAWPDERVVEFSGTSASAPILAGAIAATMSNGSGTRLTAQQATAIVLANLDEAGYPGTDPLYGHGLVDMGRVIRRDQPGVVDAAVASQVVAPPADGRPYPELLVTIENRGTSLLVNSSVEVTTPNGQVPLNVTTLAPGKTQTFHVGLPVNTFDSAEPLAFTSVVTTTGGKSDAFLSNNRRTDVIAPPTNGN